MSQYRAGSNRPDNMNKRKTQNQKKSSTLHLTIFNRHSKFSISTCQYHLIHHLLYVVLSLYLSGTRKMASRDLELAKNSYDLRDVEASVVAHNSKKYKIAGNDEVAAENHR